MRRQARTVGEQIYVAAKGAPFSDEDALVIGRELEKIAAENSVDDVRSLDKHLVLKAVEADSDHPLRRFYNWDVGEAARQHWLSHTQKLLSGIRVVTITMGKRGPIKPAFVYAEHRPRDGGATVRSHVLLVDAEKSDPWLQSIVSQQIRSIVNAVERLEQLTMTRSPSPDVDALRDDVRAAIDRYFHVLSLSSAAE